MNRVTRMLSLLLIAVSPCTAAQNGTPAVSPARAAPVADSLPSAGALQVLGRIPEPLTAEQQVAAPARSPAERTPIAGRNAVAGNGTVNGKGNGTPLATTVTPPVPVPTTTTRDSARTSEGGADVPVPAPTSPVVAPASPALVMPDTLPAAPARVAPTLDAPTRAAGTWCVQVAAPEERAKAESRRDAAQSLLLLPFVIETEKGLHKVRTRDGWTREAADAIRQRALGSGFEGVFLVDRAAPPEGAVPAAKPAVSAKPKPKAKPKPHASTKRRPQRSAR